MAHDALEQRVIEIIAKKKKLNPAALTADSTFTELGIDSLDGMDLLFTFEDAFNITIPDNVAQQMKSVREVTDSLRRVLASSGAETA